MAYAYGQLWSEVLTDGLAYCHWGGKALSERLLETIQPRAATTLDVCCGRAGTLGMLGGGLGVDRDASAVADAQSVAVTLGDARSLPYQENTFTHCLAQDPDVLLERDRRLFYREVARVLEPGGAFALQTYATQARSRRAVQRLRELGYPTHVPTLHSLRIGLAQAGLSVRSIVHLHNEYAADTDRMYERALGTNLESLLRLERELFSKHVWTGVLCLARKEVT